jgi:hypothetical protein
MFAKRARSQYFTRDFYLGLGRSAARVRACNDNQPVRLTSPSRRVALFCRWRQTAAGRLECQWHAEKAAPEAGEEGISLLAHRCAISCGISLVAA